MPLIKSQDKRFPAWSQIQDYSIVNLAGDKTKTVEAVARDAIAVVTKGRCLVSNGATETVLRERQFLELSKDKSRFTITSTGTPVELVVFQGTWTSPLGGCGFFSWSNDTVTKYVGDEVSYKKTTKFDSHYHDYDEYWIILEGNAVAVIGDELFDMAGGDCLAIGRGHRHDVASVSADIRALAFEGSIEGQKRVGHLWQHKHGLAVPAPERV